MNRREKAARKKRRREEQARAARQPSTKAAKESSAEDRVMTALHFDIDGFVRNETHEAAEAVRSDPTPAGVARAVSHAEDAAARELRRHLAILPPSPPIACDAGCSHCCWLRAEVSVLEVLRVADHLVSKLPADRLAEVRDHVIATARQVVGLGADARAEAAVPCALLVDGRCSVYEVRPLACRGCNAADADACEQSLSDGEVTNVVYAPQSALYHYASRAMVRAIDALGSPQGLLELNGALAVALTTPDVTARWLRHEPIFRDLDRHPLLQRPPSA